jgi:hypothetical protein
MDALPVTVISSPSGDYLSWGVIHISLTNALIVLAMVVVFVLALLLPFPRPPRADGSDKGGAS